MPATFRSLFQDRDFAVLWAAGAQSQVGDQLARVALSVLVFARTGSGLATATAYALTYLPAMIGGIVLTGLADILPRREVLIGCDLVRAALFALMAVPRLPFPVLCLLLVVAVLAGAPYNAAEPAVVADIFAGERYSTAIGFRTATVQAAQLVGFAVGGLVVAATGARAALVIDAATFVLSAVFLRAGLGFRPAAATGRNRGVEQIKVGLRTVAGNRRLRTLLGLAWLYGFWIVPEGLAAPYAAEHGGGPAAVGILLAANPAGNLLGALVVTRWVPPARRSALLCPLAILSGVPLLLCGTAPGVPVAALLWGLCGFLSCYLVLIITEFVASVGSEVRGQAIGLAGSGLLAAQGVGLLIGGGVAALSTLPTAIALAGGAGTLLAVPLAVARSRQVTRSPG